MFFTKKFTQVTAMSWSKLGRQCLTICHAWKDRNIYHGPPAVTAATKPFLYFARSAWQDSQAVFYIEIYCRDNLYSNQEHWLSLQMCTAYICCFKMKNIPIWIKTNNYIGTNIWSSLQKAVDTGPEFLRISKVSQLDVISFVIYLGDLKSISIVS